MHGGRPAAADEHAVALDRARIVRRAQGRDRRVTHAATAAHRQHRVTLEAGNPGALEEAALARERRAPRGRSRSRVDDGRRTHAAADEARRGGVDAIVVAKNNGTLPGGDAVARKQPLRRTEQHHAWPVVVDERDRSLDRAHRDHEPARPDVEHRIAAGETAGYPVNDDTAVGAADDGRIRQHAHTEAQELRADRRDPVRRVLAIDRCGLEVEFAAEFGLPLAQHHARAGARGRERGTQPRRASTAHEHVAGQMLDQRRWQRGGARCLAETCEVTDQSLVGAPRRPHEGLVVKTRAEEAAARLQQRCHVESKRRPAVLAACDEPVTQYQLRCGHIRYDGRSLAHRHERIRLLGAHGEEAARAAILDAAPEQRHAVSKQCRG